jgi:hypothetical protein
MKKVYCKGCRYLEVDDHLPNDLLDCKYPEAIFDTVAYDTYYEHIDSHKHRMRAYEVNKNNDCRWFEEKK